MAKLNSETSKCNLESLKEKATTLILGMRYFNRLLQFYKKKERKKERKEERKKEKVESPSEMVVSWTYY